MDCQHHPLLEEPHTAPDVDPHDSVDLAEDAEDAEDAQVKGEERWHPRMGSDVGQSSRGMSTLASQSFPL